MLRDTFMPDTKRELLYHSTSVRDLELSNSQRVEEGGRNGEVPPVGAGVRFGMMKRFLGWTVLAAAQPHERTNATELRT